MMQTFKPNTKKLKVLTPDGFQPFSGVSMRGVKPIIKLTFEKDVWVECTPEHKFYISETEQKLASDFAIGDTILSSDGDLKLISTEDLGRTEPVYDLIEVANGHRFYANSLLSSNCEFLIDDETLINSVTLAELKGIDPVLTMGQMRWYKDINPLATYLVSLDPSLGTGGDFAAMQVFEMPSMEQVGEWRHNTTPVQTQIRHLRDILKHIHDCGIEKSGFAPTTYYSMENNTLGEAALIVIESIGEENFHGLFLSEPIKKGHIRKFRKGFNTTHRTKVTACSQFKNLLETGKMQLNSKVLVSELKTFISRGVGFGAKSGENDDLISAVLLIIRMATVLSDWDPSIYDKLSEKLTEDQMPLPIFISSGY